MRDKACGGEFIYKDEFNAKRAGKARRNMLSDNIEFIQETLVDQVADEDGT